MLLWERNLKFNVNCELKLIEGNIFIGWKVEKGRKYFKYKIYDDKLLLNIRLYKRIKEKKKVIKDDFFFNRKVINRYKKV